MPGRGGEIEVDMDRVEAVAAAREKGAPPPVDDGEPLSYMDQIVEAIDSDEGIDMAEIHRLVSLEIAQIARPQGILYSKTNTERIKGLRELLKTVQESDEINRRDHLNFDGPKFRYVLQEVVKSFRRSLQVAGMDPGTVNHVLRMFRDTMAAREPELRKEVEKVSADSSLLSRTLVQIDEPTSTTQG